MTAENVSHRLIRKMMAQVGQRPHHPVIAPSRVLARHPHDESLYLGRDGRPTGILAVRGAIKLLRHELAILGQDGIGLSDASHLPQRSASQALSNFGQSDPFRVGQP